MSSAALAAEHHEGEPELNVILTMLRLLDRAALAELEHALSLLVNPAPTAAERRWESLGALATLMNALPPEPDDRVPRLERGIYERYRVEHAPTAPDHRTLVKLYGSWVRACRAAYGLLPDGRYLGPSKPWTSPALGTTRATVYSTAELYAAIELCALALGRIPSSGDYQRWSISTKRRGRQRGAGLRIPDIKVLYRLYPRGKNRWRLALADARLNEVTIAIARAKRLLGVAGVSERPDEPLARLKLLTDGEFASIGLSADEGIQVRQDGFGWLPLAKATALARLLGGSLDWLAGLSLDPAQPPTEASAFDPDAFADLLASSKIPAKRLREDLDLPVGPYRDLVTGRREPILAELIVIATIIGCQLDRLVAGN